MGVALLQSPLSTSGGAERTDTEEEGVESNRVAIGRAAPGAVTWLGVGRDGGGEAGGADGLEAVGVGVTAAAAAAAETEEEEEGESVSGAGEDPYESPDFCCSCCCLRRYRLSPLPVLAARPCRPDSAGDSVHEVVGASLSRRCTRFATNCCCAAWRRTLEIEADEEAEAADADEGEEEDEGALDAVLECAGGALAAANARR